MSSSRLLLAALLLCGAATLARAEEVNLYSARHYDSDRVLYDRFTKETGIKVRLIEGDADQLIERIRNEGANSPADVFITVDAARLARAADAGILAPLSGHRKPRPGRAARCGRRLVRHFPACPRDHV